MSLWHSSELIYWTIVDNWVWLYTQRIKCEILRKNVVSMLQTHSIQCDEDAQNEALYNSGHLQ